MSKQYPLYIEKLTHYYPGATLPVFSDVDLQVGPGEFLSILGPSGCGKTTLLRAIAGLVTPANGDIWMGGTQMVQNGQDKVTTQARHVGLVFQDYALFPYQTVAQNIGFGLQKLARKNKTQYKARVDELLELIGMEKFAARKPSELSGGQQQRVALARVLAPRPQLLLLDEPFANIDVTLRYQLAQELRRIVQHTNVSVVLVTHDRNEAFTLADKVAVLASKTDKQGARLCQCDTPEQVYQCPLDKTVASLSGAVSFLPAKAQGMIAQTALGQVPLLQNFKGQGQLVVRPEMARFILDDSGPCSVDSRLFQGRGYRLVCQTPVGNFLIDVEANAAPKVGARGRIVIDKACWLIEEGHMQMPVAVSQHLEAMHA